MTISLTEAKQIQDIPCSQNGEVEFYPDGQLLSCVLSEGKLQYKAGDRLLFDKNGNISDYDEGEAWEIKEREWDRLLDQLQ